MITTKVRSNLKLLTISNIQLELTINPCKM